jgi:hypothetical protein
MAFLLSLYLELISYFMELVIQGTRNPRESFCVERMRVCLKRLRIAFSKFTTLHLEFQRKNLQKALPSAISPNRFRCSFEPFSRDSSILLFFMRV